MKNGNRWALVVTVGALAGCSHDARREADPEVPIDAAWTTPAIDAAGGDGGTGESESPGEDCSAYPFRADTLYAERVGFGRHTTGGEWTNVYRVTTLADAGPGSLRAGLESTQPYWIVFDVNGVIDLATPIRVRSNKTIDGRGRDITIDGSLRLDAGTRNVIISDVKLQDPEGFATSTGDLISVRGHGSDDPEQYDSRDLWFHHLELARGGDGQLDNRGATYVTISWSHMHSHAKSMLHTNDADQNPSRGNRTTYHHNFFDRVSRRGPQFHWGHADFFNNLHYRWYEYGVASQRGAQLLSQANIYEARPGQYCIPSCPDPNSPTGDADFEVSKIALTPEWDAEPGYVKSVGDVVVDGAVVTERMPNLVFDRATNYAATIDPPDATLRQTLMTKTGPRRSYCQ